jgi:ubiquinone/menaquinone biosynthesis C-methylase UbiE
MDQFEALLSGQRVLDVGCGPGRDVDWLTERGHHAIGIDLSNGMLQEARRRLPDARLIRGDLAALPFPSASFDGVWCCSVFVHLNRAESAAALVEMARVLRPEASLYLGLEEGAEPEWRSDAHAGRRHFFFRHSDELAGEMESSGFRVVEQYREQVGTNIFLTAHAVRQ